MFIIRFLIRLWFFDRNRLFKIVLKWIKRDLSRREKIYNKLSPSQRKEWLCGKKDPVICFIREVIKLSNGFDGGEYIHG